MKKEKESAGSICGGVMSQSQMNKGIKRFGVYYGMMSYILPDEQYKKYTSLLKSGKNKEAQEIFDKHAHSVI